MSDQEPASQRQLSDTQPLDQPSSKSKVLPVLLLSILWAAAAYFVVVVTYNSVSTFKSGIVVTDYLSLLTPGVFSIFFSDPLGGSKLFPFLLDSILALAVAGLSTFLFFHRRVSNILFFVISGLFILFSVLVLLTLFQECEGLGCIGHGFAFFFELAGFFVSASILPVLWLSRKELDATKVAFSSRFVSGIPIFIGVTLISVLSMSPLLVGRVSEISKTSSEVEKAKSKIGLEDFPTFSDDSRVTRTNAHGTTIVVQYSNGINLAVGEIGSNKGSLSYQIARDVIEGRDKDKFANNPDYLLQERVVGDVIVTFFRSQLGDPQVVFISYKAFFSLGNKDFKVEYGRNPSKKGFSEEEFYEIVEFVISFYKQ